MKVGGAGSQPTQNRTLGLADIGAFAGNQSPGGIRGLLSRPIAALDGVHRKVTDVQSRQRWKVGNADVNGERERMIADIRSIVARGAESVYGGQARKIVETCHSGDSDR